ncbi:MAG: hypothetical protein DI531_11005 [Brevundimonas sp.]|uniref:FkbM family methyltransferase n=1 Tax=Brevundimonas sp. TaxID=1871086 RepID=UPI000DB0E9A4|nr:FkbM family methyltransferase [Brevundimonas sp.]PZU73207.1 MAG: hypothetical protein DI531_11005 [Brevundimonas sp.]
MSGEAAHLEERLSLIEARIAKLQEMIEAGLQRQIVSLDDDFVGIRSKDGWIVAGAEEFRTVLHLADGVSGHEPGVQALLKRAVKAGDVVVDVGAHIGLISVELARHVGREGRVILVEPNPRSAEAARRTLLSNGFGDRFDLHVAAGGAKAGRATYFFGFNSMLGSLAVLEGSSLGSLEVDVAPLDDIVPPGQAVSLVKIDAEGWENEVAKGMVRLCKDSPDILVIAEFASSHLARTGVTPTQWFDDFAALGLSDFSLIDEQTGALSPCGVERLMQMETANILLERPGAGLRRRFSRREGARN